MNNIIAYIGRFEFPDKNAAAIRVRMIAKLLKLIGYNCTFITTDNNENKEITEIDGSNIVYSSKKKSTNYYSKDYIKILSKYEKLTAIIAYNLPSNILYNIMKYAKKNNIIIIADVTEWYGTSGYSFMRKIFKKIDTFIRMRYLHKKMDGLILISKSLSKYYKKINHIILPPLIDKLKFYKKSEINTNKVNFIYAGNPGKNKDYINNAIMAFEKMEIHHNFNFNFKVYGINKEQYTLNFPNVKLYLNKTKNILFFGKVSRTEVLNSIEDADYFIFTRKSTRANNFGFPTKFVESISLGTPVITNKTSDLGSYLINGKNGFIVSDLSVNKMYELIYNICENNIKIKISNDLINTFNYENYKDSLRLLMEKIYR